MFKKLLLDLIFLSLLGLFCASNIVAHGNIDDGHVEDAPTTTSAALTPGKLAVGGVLVLLIGGIALKFFVFNAKKDTLIDPAKV